MPNHCENDLIITGNVDAVTTVLEKVEGGVEDHNKIYLDFNKIIPMPSAYSSDDGWYEWCIENWGTKWNAYWFGEKLEEKIKKGNKTKLKVTLTFSTAWSPPTPVIEALITHFPACEFDLKYYECGCAFKGHLKGKNGSVVVNTTSDYRGNRGG